VTGAGLKQISFTRGIGGGQPGPERYVPWEITRNGARYWRSRRKAALTLLPRLSSITIALTRAGMPWAGQMNNRPVAVLTMMTSMAATIRAVRLRLRHRDRERPAGPSVPPGFTSAGGP